MFGIRLGLPPGVGLRGLGAGSHSLRDGECARLRILCATPTTPRPRKKERARAARHSTGLHRTRAPRTCAPHTRVHQCHSFIHSESAQHGNKVHVQRTMMSRTMCVSSFLNLVGSPQAVSQRGILCVACVLFAPPSSGFYEVSHQHVTVVGLTASVFFFSVAKESHGFEEAFDGYTSEVDFEQCILQPMAFSFLAVSSGLLLPVRSRNWLRILYFDSKRQEIRTEHLDPIICRIVNSILSVA